MNRYMRNGSSERVLLLVTKKFAQGVYLNLILRSKLFGTPTAAENRKECVECVECIEFVEFVEFVRRSRRVTSI